MSNPDGGKSNVVYQNMRATWAVPWPLGPSGGQTAVGGQIQMENKALGLILAHGPGIAVPWPLGPSGGQTALGGPTPIENEALGAILGHGPGMAVP